VSEAGERSKCDEMPSTSLRRSYIPRAAGLWALWTKRVDGSGQAVLQFREKRNVYGAVAGIRLE
jgi:hypothetical protein